MSREWRGIANLDIFAHFCYKQFPSLLVIFLFIGKSLPALLQNILDTDRARRYKARTNNVHKDNIPARLVFRLRMFLITSQTSMSVALKWIFVKSLPTNFYFGNHLWNHDGFLGQRPKPSFFFLGVVGDIFLFIGKLFFSALLQIGGTDARSLAEIKRRRTCCTLSIYFGVATTQMPAYLQKTRL